MRGPDTAYSYWTSCPIPFYSFTSPYLPSILEVERTDVALNADDVR